MEQLAAVRFTRRAPTICARVYAECHRTLENDDGPVPSDDCEATVVALDRFAAGYLTTARCAEIADVRTLSNEALCRAACSTTNVEVSCVVALPDDAFHTHQTPCGLPPRF